MAKSCVSYQRTITITVVNFQLKRCIERSFLSYVTVITSVCHRSSFSQNTCRRTCGFYSRADTISIIKDFHAGFNRGRVLIDVRVLIEEIRYLCMLLYLISLIQGCQSTTVRRSLPPPLLFTFLKKFAGDPFRIGQNLVFK